ncbi:MAG: hemolysin III family protein [Planctomycetota bacterium]|nr:MAG: hemolysin III family protein [Planctomycetota bacterium]
MPPAVGRLWKTDPGVVGDEEGSMTQLVGRRTRRDASPEVPLGAVCNALVVRPEGGGGASPVWKRWRFWDERANQVTHLIGAVWSVWAAAALMRAVANRGDTLRWTGCLVYGLSLVAVYVFSFLSHSFAQPAWRHAFRTLDQVAIFLLIAGSYTPVGVVYGLEGGWWLVLAGMWAMALVGIWAKLRVAGLRNVSVWYYLATAWFVLCAIPRLIQVLTPAEMAWVLAGAVAYTGGVWFLLNDRRWPFLHALWHLSVLAGSVCHYQAIFSSVAAR